MKKVLVEFETTDGKMIINLDHIVMIKPMEYATGVKETQLVLSTPAYPSKSHIIQVTLDYLQVKLKLINQDLIEGFN